MIHFLYGQAIEYNAGECGIYKSPDGISRPEYAVMDISHTLHTLNRIPREDAIIALEELQTLARTQAAWRKVPANGGHPFLVQSGTSTPIEGVRKNIQNTEQFCEVVLKALSGE